jgi:hypothetical protein
MFKYRRKYNSHNQQVVSGMHAVGGNEFIDAMGMAMQGESTNRRYGYWRSHRVTGEGVVDLRGHPEGIFTGAKNRPLFRIGCALLPDINALAVENRRLPV